MKLCDRPGCGQEAVHLNTRRDERLPGRKLSTYLCERCCQEPRLFVAAQQAAFLRQLETEAQAREGIGFPLDPLHACRTEESEPF